MVRLEKEEKDLSPFGEVDTDKGDLELHVGGDVEIKICREAVGWWVS
jgi:hypothetical protein